MVRVLKSEKLVRVFVIKSRIMLFWYKKAHTGTKIRVTKSAGIHFYERPYCLPRTVINRHLNGKFTANGSAHNNFFTRWGAWYFVWWQLSSFMSYLARWVQWFDYGTDDCTWDLSTGTEFSLRHSFQAGCIARSVTAPKPNPPARVKYQRRGAYQSPPSCATVQNARKRHMDPQLLPKRLS
jgi:hypothetical protein